MKVPIEIINKINKDLADERKQCQKCGLLLYNPVKVDNDILLCRKCYFKTKNNRETEASRKKVI